MARILIADDDDAFREGLVEALTDSGHDVLQAENGREALRAFERERIDVALLDLRMPGLSGLQVMAQVQAGQLARGVPIIMLTGFADAANTIEAMRLGAFDHLTKPVGREPLLAALDAALSAAREQAAHQPATDDRPNDDPHDDPNHSDALRHTRRDAFIGASDAMRDLQKRIGLAARSEAPVLVTGETGSGKEVVARLLHTHGARAAAPFVAVNCAAIPAELIESELFGHVKGAFSGAVADRPGRFAQAHRGVLFLDEIGDMPLPMQAKLLRVLQDREITPVGGTKAQPVDVRIVAATHRDLARAAAEGRFRADLRFRLDVLRIHLPPLRARLADIVPLAEHFLRLADPAKRLSREAAQRLMGHAWPGNVRELRNVMERAAAATRSELLVAADIELGDAIDADLPANGASSLVPGQSLPEAVAALERRMFGDALERSAGNRAEAARVLGIRRQLLYAKLTALGLDAPR